MLFSYSNSKPIRLYNLSELLDSGIFYAIKFYLFLYFIKNVNETTILFSTAW